MSQTQEQEFIALIRQHNGMIHKICRMYRDSLEDREDLFQEITYQLWRSYPSFDAKAKKSTWLYRVALNTAIATFRKKMPEVSYTDVLPDLQLEELNEELAHRQDRFFAALKNLDEGDKALIALYLEELTYLEIAEIMGIKENYVGVKINRLKTKIQNEILRQNGTR
ncbi:RNA polymerase ECF-type sigma factor [Pedobacter sp. BAL39]|uniref:RNA polymerase sigma factor n=1 Tax=Pedobacter sp. BAL39 TaxID=391596 RepID=UPI0001559C8F|nr:sigma-70 family RNA polymerase sigma factor [Pedobacter sp. BAL39]EDM38087.1 RNA polymerase ECF-type sigma factor [Pedobacter sp. BAL39]